MNWQEIIISVLSVIITGFASWGVAVLTAWLGEKLKGKKSERYIFAILEVVTSCVKATYQTYVEAIKDTDAWTKEAQEKALKMALESAKAQLDDELKGYITETFGSVDAYIIGLIESVIYDLKK